MNKLERDFSDVGKTGGWIKLFEMEDGDEKNITTKLEKSL